MSKDWKEFGSESGMALALCFFGKHDKSYVS
jgi:hypothetical protein